MTDEAREPIERFFAAALMAIGALIFGLCGACTLGFVGTGLYMLVRYPGGAAGTLAIAPIVAAVGGTPTVLGFLMMRWGHRRYRAHGPPPSGPADG